MNFLIAGGTGLIGQAWLNAQESFNHTFTILSRTPHNKNNNNHIKFITWSDFDSIQDQHFDCILNLCGKNIGHCRWTKNNKNKMIQSRIEPSKKLHHYHINHPKTHVIHASGVSIYGLQAKIPINTPPFDESFDIPSKPDSFMQKLAIEWEQSSSTPSPQQKTTWLRLAPVLSDQGGILPSLLKSYKIHLGGIIGSGKQPFSWIHIEDVIEAINFILEHQLYGPINLCAPEVITQQEFHQTLQARLEKKQYGRFPAWFYQCLLGKMADECLFKGQAVSPEKLLSDHFKFNYPNLSSALNSFTI